MNTVSLPQSVAIHKQSHKIPFQDCWSVSVLHKLPDSTLHHISHQFEIAYQLMPWTKHSLTPSSSLPPAHQWHLHLSVLLLMKGTEYPKAPISFGFITVCLMKLICWPNNANQLSEVSATLSPLPFVFKCTFQVFPIIIQRSVSSH